MILNKEIQFQLSSAAIFSNLNKLLDKFLSNQNTYHIDNQISRFYQNFFVQFLLLGYFQFYNINHNNDLININQNIHWMLKMMLNAGTKNHQQHNYGYLPYFLGLLSSIIWPLGWIYSNQHNLPMCQTTMIRGITSLIGNFIVCKLGDCPLTFHDKRTFKILVFRGFIFTLSSLVIGMAQFILPLNIAHVIISSSTLFVFAIDYFVNNVNINMKQGVGITIGLIGTLLASNGRALAQWVDESYQQKSQFHYITQDLRIITLFTIIFIVMIGLWSYGFVLTKGLNYNAFQVNYFLGLFYLLIGGIIYQIMPVNPSQNPNQVLPKAENFYWGILYTGIPLLLDQCFLILSLLMCKQSGVITMLSYNSIIVSYLVSIFRYKQRPNMFVNLGVALLAIGLYQTIFNSSNLKNENEQNEDSQSNEQGNQDPTMKIQHQNINNQRTRKMSKVEKQKYQCRMPSD